MNQKIDIRYRALLFALLMSGCTSLMVSGTIIYLRTQSHSTESHSQFAQVWLSSFLIAWPIVFAAILIIAPLINKLINLFVDAQ